MVIFKYEIPIRGKGEVELPKDSRILHVGTQNNGIFAWVLVPDPENKSVEKVQFSIYGTGQEFSDSDQIYMNTVFLNNDTLVFHVFVSRNCGTVTSVAKNYSYLSSLCTRQLHEKN